VFKIKKFNCQWNVTINNGGTGYSILPNNVGFAYINELGNAVSDYNVVNEFNVAGAMINSLAVSSGSVLFFDATSKYHTVGYSETAPQAIVAASFFGPASILAYVESNLNRPEYGQIFIGVLERGAGYNAPFDVTIAPTIAGAPGSGAAFKLTDFTRSPSSEYKWGGNYATISKGSGYLPNLNRVNEYLIGSPTSTDEQNFSAQSGVLVKSGATIINDVVYGTGDRKEKVFNAYN
jgi:hypothetical protein